MLDRAVNLSHKLLAEIILPGDLAIDATCGNGYDTLFLAKSVGSTGRVFGFDIQEAAVKKTQLRLNEEKLEQQVRLFNKGHETLNEVLSAEDSVKAAIFNLGYLPNSDKRIITLPETTLQALKILTTHLQIGGRICLVVYHGHAGGELEKNAVLSYCKKLPQDIFSVAQYGFVNQKNNPPFLLCIEKK